MFEAMLGATRRAPSFPQDALRALRTLPRSHRCIQLPAALSVVIPLDACALPFCKRRRLRQFAANLPRAAEAAEKDPYLATGSCRQPRRFAFCAWHLLEHKVSGRKPLSPLLARRAAPVSCRVFGSACSRLHARSTACPSGAGCLGSIGFGMAASRDRAARSVS